ncbi:hypothetical protein BJY04DRAFT_221710 [Aspergillus karnatakaensis]|uniref:uncharacterized protein n=1 Tax=Aspergillus karnatakaensis TaxID=1810916 RepID=UPI003CCC9C07
MLSYTTDPFTPLTQCLVLTGIISPSLDPSLTSPTPQGILDSFRALLQEKNYTNFEIRLSLDASLNQWRLLVVLGGAMHTPSSDPAVREVIKLFVSYVGWEETCIHRVKDVECSTVWVLCPVGIFLSEIAGGKDKE